MDRTEELKKGLMVGYPDHWPNIYNGSEGPCDMLQGPCLCGKWHDRNEAWVQAGIDMFGLEIKKRKKI